MRANWWRWNEERPEWFGEAWVNKLPNDFVPEDEEEQLRVQMIRKKGRLERQTSSTSSRVLVPVDNKQLPMQ